MATSSFQEKIVLTESMVKSLIKAKNKPKKIIFDHLPSYKVIDSEAVKSYFNENKK